MHKLVGHHGGGHAFGGQSHNRHLDEHGGVKAKKPKHFRDGGKVPGFDSGGRADRSSRKKKKGDTNINISVAPHNHPPGPPGGGMPPPPPPGGPGGGGPPHPPMPPGGGGAPPGGGIPNMPGMPNMMGAAGMGGAGSMGAGQVNPAALRALAGAGGLGAAAGGRKSGGRVKMKLGGRAPGDGGTGHVIGLDKGSAVMRNRDHWEKYAQRGQSGGKHKGASEKTNLATKDLYAMGGPIRAGRNSGANTGVHRKAEQDYYKGRRGAK